MNEAFETLETKKQRRYLLSRESFFSKSERRQAEEKRLESKQDGGWEVQEGKRGGGGLRQKALQGSAERGGGTGDRRGKPSPWPGREGQSPCREEGVGSGRRSSGDEEWPRVRN